MTQITSDVLFVSDLFEKGNYIVPWHQRYYDWEVEQVSELLVDLKEAFYERRAGYFLGSIMLVRQAENWEINDGQQRMVTLSLIVAAFVRKFAADRDNHSGREMLALRILFDRPPSAVNALENVSREPPRIQPPRRDRSSFDQIIRGRNIGTNGKLTSAWNEIDQFVNKIDDVELGPFFDFLTRQVEISVLYVPKTEDPNVVFETLNGRGKQLDDVDLIRNHLYSHFNAPGDAERRKTVHTSLERVVEVNRSPKRNAEYFRCFFQCKFGYLQKKRFYRDTRARVRSSHDRDEDHDYVYQLVCELADAAAIELFRTITSSSPSVDLLRGFHTASTTGRKKRNLSVFLHELTPYTVAVPIIFSLLRRFIEATRDDRRPIAKAVHRCISDLASFLMRVSFCRKVEPSRYEAAFATCAKRISDVSDGSDFEIMTDLRGCDDLQIVDDRRFVSRLLDLQVTDKRRARRLLFGVNAQMDSESRALRYEGSTVEHILPQSSDYWEGWKGFQSVGADLREWVMRIGNLTLLGDSDNHGRERFNSCFANKKEVFKSSPFAITRVVAERRDWTPATIEQRSKRLASAAARVWSFSLE